MMHHDSLGCLGIRAFIACRWRRVQIGESEAPSDMVGTLLAIDFMHMAHDGCGGWTYLRPILHHLQASACCY
jgi:hypothetical protein